MSDKSFDVIVQEIESGAKDVRSAGTEVSDRIRIFESWLAKLPGVVYAECELWGSEDGRLSTNLALRKDGKGWSLYICTEDNWEGHGDLSESQLLRDSSLDTKLAAIRHFPSLLCAIAKRQKELVDQLRRAASEYDEFAKSVGIKEGT